MTFYAPMICVAAAAAAIVVAVAARARARARLESLSVLLALAATVAATLLLTLAPMDASEHHVRLVPLSDLVEALTPPDRTRLLEKAFNVVLFLPLGAALALRGLSLGRTVLVATAFSAAVELTQAVFVTGRTTSFDDVLFNTLGAAVGHALLQFLVPKRELRGISQVR